MQTGRSTGGLGSWSRVCWQDAASQCRSDEDDDGGGGGCEDDAEYGCEVVERRGTRQARGSQKRVDFGRGWAATRCLESQVSTTKVGWASRGILP
jgi:hypothetical protein